MQGLDHVEINYAGVGELLKSSETVAMLAAEASARCPSGCVVDTFIGRNRANARITTDTEEAFQDNLENNTLLKAVGG